MYELIFEEEDFPYPTKIIMTFDTFFEALERINAEKFKGDLQFVSLIRRASVCPMKK